MPNTLADENLVGVICPECHIHIAQGNPIHIAEDGTGIYHLSCWQMRGCGVRGNTSGIYPSIPPEIADRLNLGAFLLGPVWAVGNKCYIGLLGFFPAITFIMSIILMIKGNAWAWQNRRFESVEQFQAVQIEWIKWGILAWIVGFVLMFAYCMRSA